MCTLCKLDKRRDYGTVCHFFHFLKEFFSVYCNIGSGGSRNSGKGVHMYKGEGDRFVDFISFFLNIP